MDKFDVVVAGGGMVGAMVANLLATAELSVLVVDPFNGTTLTFNPAPALRTSAFNRFSLGLLQHLDVWRYVTESRRAAYTGLETWEQKQQPLVFNAAAVNAEYLGHILENNLIQHALWQNFAALKIQTRCPATIQAITHESEQAIVTLNNGDQVSAKLVIGADGGQSRVRQLANIGVEGWQYQQHCLAITVEMETQQPPVTWQQFHPSGPRAYLPLFGQYASLIWYDDADRIAELKLLSNSQLSQQIEAAFPARLGAFKLVDKGAFGLTRMHAKRYYAERIALIGDAAHTINPLAGQGVNLGFKDADKLAQLVIAAFTAGEDIGHVELLKKYHQARYSQNLLMMSAMDLFYLGFSNNSKPLKWLRNLGLNLANKATPIKNRVMKYAMGEGDAD